jgi:DNA-binding transcriptional ArsR family regulator
VGFTLTGNHIVAYRALTNVDEVFRALSDRSRRRLLDRLHDDNGQTLVQLSRNMEMSRQAVMKHLAILEDANLVTSVKRGRERLHYLNPVPIAEIYDRWIRKYERQRLEALSNLKSALIGDVDE